MSRVQQMDLHVSHRQSLLTRDERRTFNMATILRHASVRNTIAPPAVYRRLATSGATPRPSFAAPDRLARHSDDRVQWFFHPHLVTAAPGRRDAVDRASVPAPGPIAGASVVVPVGPVARDLAVRPVARRLMRRAGSVTDAALDAKPAPPFGAGPVPVPMVMRRPPVESRQAEAAPVAVGSRAGAGSAAATAAVAGPPQARATAWPHVPAPQRLNLDGPAIDRLAEDVMHRIDRRLRIERERRGL
jgi:hypothetical protein